MSSQHIAAPRPPESAPPFRFPVVACVAPVVVAVLLWAVTNSPYTLLFAVLGPVTALASVADARLGTRRARRRDRARFERDSLAAAAAIEAAHAEERATLAERTPSAAALLAVTGVDPWRWTAQGPAVPIALGTGAAHSDLRVDGADDELHRRASVLSDAPVVVDAALGIGVCGPQALAAAVARSVAVQVAWTLSPATHWCAPGEPWAAALPHAAGRVAREGVIAEFGRAGEPGPIVTIAAARQEASLPPECRVVVSIGSGGAAIVHHPDRSRRGAVRLGPVSAESAHQWAMTIAAEAARAGLIPPAASLPDTVPLAGLAVPRGGAGLACAVGVDASGPVTIDLVAQGPHAVVGGTTGSGKSELLVSWVLAMALAWPPEKLTVLLIDFKGGSAFGPLEHLPHTVGIVTDLDESRAARALASLSAELRHRERVLADARARDIDDVDSLPRLVIVVDEFAAMLADQPGLHALFVDIASRGRSLGVHLVLCTQRPAGVVRDAVLANADLRVSLRVNNRADSSAVVGTDAAAHLSPAARGRGVLAPPDSEPRLVQFALSSDADVQRAASRWPDSPTPRRPWCEPLPAVVAVADAPGGFGLTDLPHEQRRGLATWSPARDGSVLVLGAAGSGASTALAALAALSPVAHWLPRGVPAAWDALAEVEGARDTVLVIDDADSLLARFPPEYRSAVVERLAALLRDGPSRGVYLALSAQRLTADLVPLAALTPARLLLRHASKQDWVLAGGEGAAFSPALPPGGGLWRGDSVQVVAAAPYGHAERAPIVERLDGSRAVAVVTTRPGAVPGAVPLAVADLTALRPGHLVVGDVEEWQSRWGAIAAVRQVADVVLDACTPADVRTLTRSRELPPPLTGLAGVAWWLDPRGGVSRVRFDPAGA